jgi:hypothetical protein
MMMREDLISYASLLRNFLYQERLDFDVLRENETELAVDLKNNWILILEVERYQMGIFTLFIQSKINKQAIYAVHLLMKLFSDKFDYSISSFKLENQVKFLSMARDVVFFNPASYANDYHALNNTICSVHPI